MMTLNFQDLSPFTWKTFFNEVYDGFSDGRRLLRPSYRWFWTPYYLTIRTIDLDNTYVPDHLLKAWVMTEHKGVPNCPNHRLCFMLSRASSVLPFDIYFCIYIIPNREDKALWGAYYGTLEAMNVLNVATGNPKCSFNWNWSRPRSMQEFHRFFEDLDLAMTRLALHPQRDRFLKKWQDYFQLQSSQEKAYEYLTDLLGRAQS